MAIGRSDSMQELITIMESMYKETIIGSDINLVRHLFYYLKADAKEFDILYEEEWMVAAVEEIYTETLRLIVPSFSEKGVRRARVKFEVMNILYQFEIIILDIDGQNLTVKIPTELQSVQLRQNRRMPVDDLFMNFIIMFRSLSGGQREVGKNLNAEAKFPHLMKEIRRDSPDLKLINLMISDSIRAISQDYEIVFYSNPEKEPDNTHDSFIRETILKYEKTIYIPDCTKIENYFQETEDSVLINYSDRYRDMVTKEGRDNTREFFKEFQKQESRNFLVSYIYAPIRLYGLVAGHIKVFSTAMDRFTLNPTQAYTISELAEIASYAFTKIAIRGSSIDSMQTNTRIVDISLDGLLFEVEQEKLFHYLKRHNIIKMFIPLNQEHRLVLKGEIVRHLKRDDGMFCGVNFFDASPDDMLHLEDFLHQKGMNALTE